MNEISADELKAKIDRGDDFRLVMTLGVLAFQGKHIPALSICTNLRLWWQSSLQRKTSWSIAQTDCARQA